VCWFAWDAHATSGAKGALAHELVAGCQPSGKYIFCGGPPDIGPLIARTAAIAAIFPVGMFVVWLFVAWAATGFAWRRP
jgi:hypothetical protein